MKTFFFELAGLTQLVPLQAPERRARNSKPARLPSQFSQDFRSRARVIVFYMFTLLSGQFLQKQHCNPVQGKYRASTGFSLCTFSTQGKTCVHYREPLFSLQGPLFSLQGFPCEKTSQGKPCFHYREWVCSAVK